MESGVSLAAATATARQRDRCAHQQEVKVDRQNITAFPSALLLPEWLEGPASAVGGPFTAQLILPGDDLTEMCCCPGLFSIAAINAMMKSHLGRK